MAGREKADYRSADLYKMDAWCASRRRIRHGHRWSIMNVLDFAIGVDLLSLTILVKLLARCSVFMNLSTWADNTSWFVTKVAYWTREIIDRKCSWNHKIIIKIKHMPRQFLPKVFTIACVTLITYSYSVTVKSKSNVWKWFPIIQHLRYESANSAKFN